MATNRICAQVQRALKRSASARKPSTTVLGILALLALYALAGLVLSLLFGLLALLIEQMLGSTLAPEQLRGIIVAVSSGITLAVMPVVLIVLFSYGLGHGSIKEGIVSGLTSLKRSYLKVLVVLLAYFAAGWLISALFARMPALMPLFILKVVLLVALCVAYLFTLLVLLARRAPVHANKGRHS
ncbi:MAG: hypothetical protein LBU48_06630 [Coriobacteriales bacterium]|nr:hypothetical protein [Coriobacteriales bacterium]